MFWTCFSLHAAVDTLLLRCIEWNNTNFEAKLPYKNLEAVRSQRRNHPNQMPPRYVVDSNVKKHIYQGILTESNGHRLSPRAFCPLIWFSSQIDRDSSERRILVKRNLDIFHFHLPPFRKFWAGPNSSHRENFVPLNEKGKTRAHLNHLSASLFLRTDWFFFSAMPLHYSVVQKDKNTHRCKCKAFPTYA